MGDLECFVQYTLCLMHVKAPRAGPSQEIGPFLSGPFIFAKPKSPQGNLPPMSTIFILFTRSIGVRVLSGIKQHKQWHHTLQTTHMFETWRVFTRYNTRVDNHGHFGAGFSIYVKSSIAGGRGSRETNH
jgi:hypothetical protein